jgi:hypothetical protein
MKTIKSRLLVVAVASVFSQFALADAASAQKSIAGILAGMNHFPSDAQKEELMAIAADDTSGRGNQMIAAAVHDIQHAATAEGKAAMQQIIDYAEAPEGTKVLARTVLEFNHMASDEAKAALAGL